jgi:hypothetical protein
VTSGVWAVVDVWGSLPPLTEQEKQTLPLPGEVSPQDLLSKALTYATIVLL